MHSRQGAFQSFFLSAKLTPFTSLTLLLFSFELPVAWFTHRRAR
jgi:hypothetical protein